MSVVVPPSPYRLFLGLLAPIASVLMGCSGTAAPRTSSLPAADAEGASVVVVYPRSACAGAARTVLTDEGGGFLAAVAPGEATRVILPAGAKGVRAFSSAAVAASPGSGSHVETVGVDPPPPALLVGDASECGRVQQADAGRLASELAENDVAWVPPRVDQGQRWLAMHKARVDEILAGQGRTP